MILARPLNQKSQTRQRRERLAPFWSPFNHARPYYKAAFGTRAQGKTALICGEFLHFCHPLSASGAVCAPDMEEQISTQCASKFRTPS
jgi:hypothetical protein